MKRFRAATFVLVGALTGFALFLAVRTRGRGDLDAALLPALGAWAEAMPLAPLHGEPAVQGDRRPRLESFAAKFEDTTEPAAAEIEEGLPNWREQMASSAADLDAIFQLDHMTHDGAGDSPNSPRVIRLYRASKRLERYAGDRGNAGDQRARTRLLVDLVALGADVARLGSLLDYSAGYTIGANASDAITRERGALDANELRALERIQFPVDAYARERLVLLTAIRDESMGVTGRWWLWRELEGKTLNEVAADVDARRASLREALAHGGNCTCTASASALLAPKETLGARHLGDLGLPCSVYQRLKSDAAKIEAARSFTP